jgi:hypothetical protein
MDEFIPYPEYSKEDLDKAFEEALAAAEDLHKKLTSASEDVGYIKNVFIYAKNNYDGLYLKAQNDPSIYPIIASGIAFLKGMTDEINGVSGIIDQAIGSISPVSSSSETFSNTSGSASILFDIGDRNQVIPPPPHRKSRDHYSDQLNTIDHALANTYKEVWQTFYGTSSEPHRSALFMMRTLYDNFFATLAPDDDVRGSQFWHRKEGKDPDQIWRRERIAYSLSKNIKDENRRSTLGAETDQIIFLYEAVNMAHKRGSLDEEKASKTLFSMDNSLKDWLDALSNTDD